MFKLRKWYNHYILWKGVMAISLVPTWLRLFTAAQRTISSEANRLLHLAVKLVGLFPPKN